MKPARHVRLSRKRQLSRNAKGKSTFGELAVGQRFALAGRPDEVWTKKDVRTAVCGASVMDAMDGSRGVSLRASQEKGYTATFKGIDKSELLIEAKKRGVRVENAVQTGDKLTADLYSDFSSIRQLCRFLGTDSAKEIKASQDDNPFGVMEGGSYKVYEFADEDDAAGFVADCRKKQVKAIQKGVYVKTFSKLLDKLADQHNTVSLSSTSPATRVRFSFADEIDRDNFLDEVEFAFRSKPLRSMIYNSSFEAHMSNPNDVRKVERIAQKYFGIEMSLVKSLSMPDPGGSLDGFKKALGYLRLGPRSLESLAEVTGLDKEKLLWSLQAAVRLKLGVARGGPNENPIFRITDIDKAVSVSQNVSLQKGDEVRLRVADGLPSRRRKLNGKTATVTGVGRDTVDVELEDGSTDRVSLDQCLKLSMTSKLKPIKSLSDLRRLAAENAQYIRLAMKAANNLGGSASSMDAAMQVLEMNANETSEKGVVREVNAIIKMLNRA